MTRALVIAFAAILVALASGLARPSTASACSCIAQSDHDYLEQADAVFIGTAVAVAQTPPMAVQASSDPVVWTFAADTVLKGTVAPDQRVVTARSSASCGADLVVGTRYLVFASAATGDYLAVDPGPGLVTGTCSGTRVLPPGARIPDLSIAVPRRPYPVYWVGDSFDGFRLAGVSEPRGRVSFDYRRCVAGRCHASLRIRTVPACRVQSADVVAPTGLGRIRGVPAGRRGGALVLFTGRAQVRILGAPSLARRVAAALLAAPTPALGGDIHSPLPRPVPWAVTQGLACPVR